MLPDSFDDILKAPSYTINLDRCSSRWSILKERAEKAGFTNALRWSGTDGMGGRCRKLWYEFGIPSDCKYEFDSDGQAGASISHAYVWKHMVENNIPYATIFEDDYLFHKDWNTIAPEYYSYTKKDTDMIFYGSQGAGGPYDLIVTQVPVFCMHAYLITLNGAKILLDELYKAKRIYVMDCFIIDLMKTGAAPFSWQCWNGSIYEDTARENSLRVRNDGIVFQDDFFESNAHCHAPPELKDCE